MYGSNDRLLSQNGVFTWTCGHDVESCAVNLSKLDKVPDSLNGSVSLLKIRVPEMERSKVLAGLNLMSINHLTLLPDLTGASLHSNTLLDIDS